MEANRRRAQNKRKQDGRKRDRECCMSNVEEKNAVKSCKIKNIAFSHARNVTGGGAIIIPLSVIIQFNAMKNLT